MAAKKKGTSKRAAIAKVHIAKKDLGFDDDTYRDMLFYCTGLRSCKDMNLDQLSRVINEFKRKGWKPKAKESEHGKKPNVTKSRQKVLGKIEAILADLSLPWSYAIGMAKNMHAKEAIEFCTDIELTKLMQALLVYQKRQQEKNN